MTSYDWSGGGRVGMTSVMKIITLPPTEQGKKNDTTKVCLLQLGRFFS